MLERHVDLALVVKFQVRVASCLPRPQMRLRRQRQTVVDRSMLRGRRPLELNDVVIDSELGGRHRRRRAC